jgi:hypothetical protein
MAYDRIIYEGTIDCKSNIDRARLIKRIRELEDMLFTLGAMNKPPCFLCGYNGPGYYQPEHHPCADRHHKLCE